MTYRREMPEGQDDVIFDKIGDAMAYAKQEKERQEMLQKSKEVAKDANAAAIRRANLLAALAALDAEEAANG